MRTCATCGRDVSDPNVTICPACGVALAALVQKAAQPAPQNSPYFLAGGFSPNAPPPAYTPPAANVRPREERRGSTPLVVALVIVLVVAVLGGVGFGAYALTLPPPPAPMTQVGATATPMATVPTNAILADPLSDNHNDWPTDTTSHCYFGDDGYHISNLAGSGHDSWICSAPIDPIRDGTVMVTVQQVSGSSLASYGIDFRGYSAIGKVDDNTYYFFGITSSGQWALNRHFHNTLTRLQDWTFNGAIQVGLKQKNTLTVAFHGQRITCEVNGLGVGVITDPGVSLGGGYVGLEVSGDINAAFTDFLVTP